MESANSQPIGPALSGWQPRPHPERRSLHGRYCSVQPLDAAAHAEELYATLCDPSGTAGWTYLSVDAPVNLEDWRSRLEQYTGTRDPLFFTVFDEEERASGMCAFMRITPEHGTIEIGSIHLSPSLQHTRAATEFQYLMMRHAFDDLGYRRYEWKCDALNAPSRRAAQRLGFRFEGIFLNAMVYKGRSRDTAWFSITDAEWPRVRRGFEAWLASENFELGGRQLQSLASVRRQE